MYAQSCHSMSRDVHTLDTGLGRFAVKLEALSVIL